MKYMIDSANKSHIDASLAMGITAITANPTMYANNSLKSSLFVETYYDDQLDFISIEPKDQAYDDMCVQIDHLHQRYPKLVIKLDFSVKGLRLVKYCSDRAIPTAMTLIFNLHQAIAAINAGANYLFVFIGRNEAVGNDGIQIIGEVKAMIESHHYQTKIVAASLKSLQHIRACALLGIDYAAIPYDLLNKSLNHNLTDSGHLTFVESNEWLD